MKVKNVQLLFKDLIRELIKFSSWQDAAKGCYVVVSSIIIYLFFALWYSFHYFQEKVSGYSYLIYNSEELLLLMKCLFSITLYHVFLLGICLLSFYKQKFQKTILNISLLSLAFCLSFLISTIGIFDGISSLIIMIGIAMGFILMHREQALFYLCLELVFLFGWFFLRDSLPFQIRMYQFTDDIIFDQMNTFELVISWFRVLITVSCGVLFLYFLTNSWSFREQDLESKSFVDELTGLYNRRAIREGLRNALVASNRSKFDLSVAMLDLDHFKDFNDNYGHQIGDKVLQIISGIMLDIARKKDLVGRYGGEEFLMVFPDCNSEQTGDILKRLQQELANNNDLFLDNTFVKITVSVGIIQVKSSENIDNIISRVDSALYAAKNQGRDCLAYG